MKRLLGLTGAVLAAVVATVLLLLALDVRRAEHRLAVGDAAVLADPSRTDLWTASEVVPNDAAHRLLGIRDDLAYRNAFRLFLLGRPWLNTVLSPLDVNTYRAEAQVALAHLTQTETNPVRKSNAFNMLGVLNLILVTPVDPQQESSALLRSSLSFRDAIAADDQDPDPKFNLEVALRLLQEEPVTGNTLRGLGGAATQNLQNGNGY
ncbi:MAG TPA: hypothetical protein VEH52_06340 [Gaiellaceae bacterium]|nr:hypothetical protein [Gaiellaceae bacterium]